LRRGGGDRDGEIRRGIKNGHSSWPDGYSGNDAPASWPRCGIGHRTVGLAHGSGRAASRNLRDAKASVLRRRARRDRARISSSVRG